MHKLVIFGTGEIGQLARWYFTRDTSYTVVAHTVDPAFLVSSTMDGLPVVPFDELPSHFPPAECACFVALSYSGLNAHRRDKYLRAKAMGYDLASYVSPHATVLNDGRIGENCFILEDNTLQPFSRIGNNVTLWSGNHIGHHAVIHDHCFVASQVVISGGVEVGESCFIGVNATLRDHIKVGNSCVIGAGAYLAEDADPFGVYQGTATRRSAVPSTRLRRI